MPTADPLAGAPVLRRLTADQQAAVAALTRPVDYPDGVRLFEQGRPAVRCWLLRTGRVDVDTAVPGRGRVVVQTLGEGDVVGWSWLVPPHRWHFGATCAGRVTALEIDAVGLRDLADRDPALGYPLVLGLFEAVLDRLQSTRSRLLDFYGGPRGR